MEDENKMVIPQG